MNSQYVVIIVHSFEHDTPVYTFGEDYERAKNFLNEKWKEYYDEEVENNSWLDEIDCFCEDEYGKVTWSDGCYTEFILSYTSNPNN